MHNTDNTDRNRIDRIARRRDIDDPDYSFEFDVECDRRSYAVTLVLLLISAAATVSLMAVGIHYLLFHHCASF